MTVEVTFWSYFADLAGTGSGKFEVPVGTPVDELLRSVYRSHPRLGALRNSTLVAVGVEYQGGSYLLQPGDSVSLFPPVQGG
jgi:molybdopterin converting factor small subunit